MKVEDAQLIVRIAGSAARLITGDENICKSKVAVRLMRLHEAYPLNLEYLILLRDVDFEAFIIMAMYGFDPNTGTADLKFPTEYFV